MIETLCRLFGSYARVKILRLFLANKGLQFDIAEIARRTKVQKQGARKELNALTKIKLLMSSGTGKSKKWNVNQNFANVRALESLVLGPDESDAGFIAGKVAGAGDVKLVVVTGMFVPEAPECEIDLLIVGNKMGKRKLETAIADIEASFGRELRFAIFSVSDFYYRMDIHDKLLRDVFDYPHEVIVDKLD